MTTLLPTRSLRDLKIHTEMLPARPSQYFPPQIQADLAQSDYEAWTAVCTILITIVSLGLVIGIGAVLLTL